MASTSIPPGWTRNFITQTYTHAATGVEITQEMVDDYGFPPMIHTTAVAIRQWYFSEMTKARIAGTFRQSQTPSQMRTPSVPPSIQQAAQKHWDYNSLADMFTHKVSGRKVLMGAVRTHGPSALQSTPLEEAEFELAEAQKGMYPQTVINHLKQKVAMLQMQQAQKQAQTAWYLPPKNRRYTTYQVDDILDPPSLQAELLLCVASSTAHIPASAIYTVSLEWLRCRTSKDSVWLLCSLIQSPRLIKLWGKDFILIQITPPGSDPISEVACGCKLKIVGPIVPGEVPQVRWEDLAIRDVPFFSISEMR